MPCEGKRAADQHQGPEREYGSRRTNAFPLAGQCQHEDENLEKRKTRQMLIKLENKFDGKHSHKSDRQDCLADVIDVGYTPTVTVLVNGNSNACEGRHDEQRSDDLSTM